MGITYSPWAHGNKGTAQQKLADEIHWVMSKLHTTILLKLFSHTMWPIGTVAYILLNGVGWLWSKRVSDNDLEGNTHGLYQDGVTKSTWRNCIKHGMWYATMQTGYFKSLVLTLHKTPRIRSTQLLALEMPVAQSNWKQNPIQLSCFLGNLLHTSA